MGSPAGDRSRTRVLFLTCGNGEDKRAKTLEDPVAVRLKESGATIDAIDIKDQALHVEDWNVVLLLRIWGYHLEIQTLRDFIGRNIEVPPRGTRFFNPLPAISWNLDKATYLPDLQRAGFPVPATEYIPLPVDISKVHDILKETMAHKSVVIKPSVSASAYSTHLIKNTDAMSAADEAALSAIAQLEDSGHLLLQEFIPEIQTSGEMSIILVSGAITHAVRKLPASGEYRTQGAHGASFRHLEEADIPPSASPVALGIWQYVQDRFCSGRKVVEGSSVADANELLYARIDGIVRSDGGFVVMEAEFIEPYLFLPGSNGKAMNRLIQRIFVP